MVLGLVVKNGPNKGVTYLLNDTVPVSGAKFAINDGITSLGRGIENDIQLNDAKASRQHCQIIKDKDTYIIRDLASRNHIKVNGKVTKEAVLTVADTITIGDTELAFSPVSKIPEGAAFPETDSNLSELKHNKTVGITSNNCSLIFDQNEFQSDIQKFKKAHEDLFALYRIGNAISSLRNLPDLFVVILDEIFDIIKADRGVLMTYNSESGEMIPRAVKRKKEPTKIDEKIPVSRTLIDHIIKTKEAILSEDAQEDDRFINKQSIIDLSVRSIICAPILYNKELVGLIYLDCDKVVHRFEESDLHFLLAIAGQAGVAIENSKLFEELHALFLDTIKTLIALIDAKDSYTRGHSERVAAISINIANVLGLNRLEKEVIRLSAILHDIGKVHIPDDVLRSKEKLTYEQMNHIKIHPQIGADIISNIKNLEEVVQAVRHHHEKFDGSGYPDGLKGKDIPLSARILCVADSFDAMISNRPYRDAKCMDSAVEEIKTHSGVQFDPEIVDAFLKSIKDSLLVFADYPSEQTEE